MTIAVEPIWVREDVVLAVHRRQLAEHGVGEGIRDIGLKQSALGKPKNLYHYADTKPSLAAMAASYAYGIALNHPFVDGNKRTAFIVCQLFLRLNGAHLEASQMEKYDIVIKLASSDLSEVDLALWIQKHIKV